MRKARFTEYQIITVLKSVEARRTVKDVWREVGIPAEDADVQRARTGLTGAGPVCRRR